jgi:hypothetical protein
MVHSYFSTIAAIFKEEKGLGFTPKAWYNLQQTAFYIVGTTAPVVRGIAIIYK